jgi:hypothetical protein
VTARPATPPARRVGPTPGAAAICRAPPTPLKNLLQPSGTTPIYPLARRLYLSTIYGFSNLLGGEQELTECFANNAIIGPAITSHGLVAVPGGVQCLDHPEKSATTVAPLANTQGKGKVALPGCNLGLAGRNACGLPASHHEMSRSGIA